MLEFGLGALVLGPVWFDKKKKDSSVHCRVLIVFVS